jgi:hypothetical protein
MDENDANKDESDAQTIERMLAENDLDGERVLGGLIALLVRDHVADRAKANGGAGTTALNHPTTLWSVEKVIAERMRDDQAEGKPHDVLLGTLAVLLVTLRERAEDQAKAAEDARPKMRLVRD